MRAAVISGTGRLELRDVELPAPEADEVAVRVLACGVCGSNLHSWQHPELTVERGGSARPGAAGHEVVGVVSAAGDQAVGLRPGDVVSVEPNLASSCGHCEACADGQAWFCRHRRELPAWGFAEEMVLAAHGALVAPAGMPPAIVSLAEPFACGIHALRQSFTAAARGGRLDGIRVAVLGAGVTGLLTLAAARHLGAGEVVVLARHDHQAEAARALGADRVLRTDASAELLRRSRPQVVVEAVGGGADTLRTALSVVDRRGEVVVLGLFDRAQEIDVRRAVYRETRLFFPVTYGRYEGVTDFAIALEVLGADPARYAGLVTHEFPLTDVQQAFLTARDKRSGSLRVVVAP